MNPTVVFDHRDTDKRTGKHRWADLVGAEMSSVTQEIKGLPLGDVVWDGAVRKQMVEIKTASDLVFSITEGHLQDQVARMVDWRENEQEGKADLYLIICGRLSADPNAYVAYSNSDWLSPEYQDKYGDIPANYEETPSWKPGFRPYTMIMSYLTSLQEMGFTVLVTAPNLFGLTFRTIYNRSRKTKHHIPAPRRNVSVVPPGQQSLLSLSRRLTHPQSAALLKYFGTFHDIVIQPIDSLVQVKGIGPVTAKEIFENARSNKFID